MTQQSSAVATGATIQAVDHNTLVTDVSTLYSALANKLSYATVAAVQAVAASTFLNGQGGVEIDGFGVYTFFTAQTYIADSRFVINIASGGQLLADALGTELVSDITGL